MKPHRMIFFTTTLLTALGLTALADAQPAPADNETVMVNSDNFVRAESDLYFSNVVKDGGFGKFLQHRSPAPVNRQAIIRLNRDTLYSAVVVDLAAGPATITLPDPGKRFMSMQVINEDEYTPIVAYGAGSHTLTEKQLGTRYVLVGIRTLVDPTDPKDLAQVHALQNALRISQKGVGNFEVPHWDQASQKKVRDALLILAAMLPDANHMFGTKTQVDPVRHLIGAASAWGGNPDKEAIYLNVTPAKNDGKTIYKLDVTNVPVDGFWSISVYNAQGYFQQNPLNAYSLNSITAKRNIDGSIAVQFGGCDGQTPNCLPVVAGWNYMVRLYRPRAEILDGRWSFPTAHAEN